jgi:hypothetical protein
LALSLPGAVESSHMQHPDFRIGGKIFATLGYPDDGWGMVKLTPEQQRDFMAAEPEAFKPCNGAWGRQGSTNVRLSAAKKGSVKAALEAAGENVAAKSSKQATKRKRPAAKTKRGADRPSQREADQVRKRVREALAALPEATAAPVGDGHLSLEVGGKRFGYLLVDHHGDGRLALSLRAAAGVARKLCASAPERFHVPKYVGRHGWVGIWLDVSDVDWDEVERVLKDAYLLTAPKSLARDVQ